MSEDKTRLDKFFDFVDSAVDKAEKVASHVHYEGKEYGEASPATIPPISPTQLLIGPVRDSRGTSGIFHLYRATNHPALCGLNQQPEIWFKPNRSARESIIICFGCMSCFLTTPAQQRMLGDGGK